MLGIFDNLENSGFRKPIGVADWETEIIKVLPKELAGSLHMVEEIEVELKDEV